MSYDGAYLRIYDVNNLRFIERLTSLVLNFLKLHALVLR